MEWEAQMTAEVEAFLDELYESDPVSHQLVNQAILVLERNGPAEGRPLNATYLMRNFGPNGITGIVMAAVVSPRLLVQVVTGGSKL